MNSLFRYIKGNTKEVIYLFTLNILIILYNFSSFCTVYLKYANFDLQTILTWDFSAANNLILYKDLYYPYGPLSYFRLENPIFTFLSIAVSIFIFNTVFYFFKKIFKDKPTLYILSLLFLFFVCFISGLDIFNRYGISVAAAMILSYLFFSKIKDNKLFLYIGFVLGTIFWLVHDQGIYLYIIFLLFYFWKKFLELKQLKSIVAFLGKTVAEMLYFLSGTFLGILIFLIYLVKNSAVPGFVNYLLTLSEFPLLSKTPFFTFAYTPNNLFSILVLSFSILFLVYKFLTKRKESLLTFLEMGLVVIILLLEQKNIIRSIAGSITFASFILVSIVLWEVLISFRKSSSKNVERYFFLTLTLVVFITLYVSNQGLKTPAFKEFSPVLDTCSYVSVENIKDKAHMSVINKLRQYKDFNNKVFSFPGDPIFYVLLNQKPPFYTSIYEASSENSQKEIINYIKNNISYVLINTQIFAIQDGVPNYVRGAYELKHLLNNYSIKDKVDNFLILKKSHNTDFFNDSKLKLAKEYRNYLLNINLESIPYSEGIYKENFIQNEKNKVEITSSGEQSINAYLSKNLVNSSGTILTIRNNIKSDKYISLLIKSRANLITKVSFKSCQKSICVINLSMLPLFYKDRQIREITSPNKVSIGIIKMNKDNFKKLW